MSYSPVETTYNDRISVSKGFENVHFQILYQFFLQIYGYIMSLRLTFSHYLFHPLYNYTVAFTHYCSLSPIFFFTVGTVLFYVHKRVHLLFCVHKCVQKYACTIAVLCRMQCMTP